MNKYKVCSTCRTILLATNENFHKSKSEKYGLRAKCKNCISNTEKERYKKKTGKNRTRKDPNEIIIHEDYAEILLYNDKGVEVARTKIDIEDIEKVKKYKWHYSYGYAKTAIKRKRLALHRYILNYKGALQVDHTNGNRLDNRKSNLRLATPQQNSMNSDIRIDNTSGVSGVSFHKHRQKWRAYLTFEGQTISLGYYYTFEEAVKVRKEAEIKYFGEYARK